jgi:ribosomal protein S18 acetylase RimI-like enzyme
MPVCFRRVSRSEALCRGEIIVEAYAKPPWNEEWSIETATSRLDELATTPGVLVCGAFDGDELVGFVFGLPHTSAIGRGLHIAEIAVLPRYQRKGIGSDLLRHMEHEALREGFVHIWLVSQRTGGVADYYLANGYGPSARVCVYTKMLADDRQPSHAMAERDFKG